MELIKVLDDGFIRVVDMMGGDSSVVQAARVSYGAGTKQINEDRGLIRYLMRHRHTTPFEMAELKVHVRVPIDIWRQWARHRTASINEYSTRYSIAIDSTHKASEWRMQSRLNRQGSDGTLQGPVAEAMSEVEASLHSLQRKIYDTRLELGVAREQARKDLPLCTYTEAYWKIDLHNLLHFLELRLSSHAQEEMRLYAQALAGVVKEWCPLTWEAFVDYRLEGMCLSRQEVAVLGRVLGDCDEFTAAEEQWPGKSREKAEFREKMRRLRPAGSRVAST